MRTFINIVLQALFILLLGTGVYAESKVIDSGVCGNNETHIYDDRGNLKEIRDDVMWTLYDDGLLRISGTGRMRGYSAYNSKGDNPWKKYNDEGKISRLIIDEGVKSIGWYAFWDCDKIKGDIVIPDSVTEIGISAFEDCSGFDGGLYLGENVKQITDNAFMNCSGLKGDLVFNKNLKYIWNMVFDGCTGFSGKVIFNEGLEFIGNMAYRNTIMEEMEKGTASTVQYSCGTFWGCSNITEVYFPSTIKYIGGGIFDYCKSLKSIYFYGDMPRIDSSGYFDFGDKNAYLGIYTGGATIYYPDGALGWTTPEWNNYKTVPLKSMPSIGQLNSGGSQNAFVANAVGKKAGDYFSTDIVTKVNGTAIDAFNIGGQTVISAEDLIYHGFSVTWNGELRTLQIKYTGENQSSSKTVQPTKNNFPVGTDIGDYYYTDIVTYLDGKEITSYNVGGRTYIWAEEMKDFGYNVIWDGVNKLLSVMAQ